MLQAVKFLSALNVAQSNKEQNESPKLKQEIEQTDDIAVDDAIMSDAAVTIEAPDAEVIAISVPPNEGGISEASEASADSIYYDPYYEPYYYHDDYSWLYSKRRVHNMTWAALAQMSIPVAMYTELTENSQTQAAVWETIAALNVVTYGPMFLSGLVALSDILPDAAAIWIEYGLSNAYIPVALYSVWQLVGVVTDGTSTELNNDIAVLAGYALFQLAMTGLVMDDGMMAAYYLNGGESHWAERYLYPQIFYWLKWVERRPRNPDDDYYYY